MSAAVGTGLILGGTVNVDAYDKRPSQNCVKTCKKPSNNSALETILKKGYDKKYDSTNIFNKDPNHKKISDITYSLNVTHNYMVAKVRNNKPYYSQFSVRGGGSATARLYSQ